MVLNLKDLFKWKKRVELIGSKGEVLGVVWVRILGDWDIQQAYKVARAASNKKRLALRNPETLDFQDEVLPIADFPREDKIDIIKSARQTVIINDATVAIKRPDIPTMGEIAKEPDAPELEEQEALDKAIEDADVSYKKEIEQYINDRLEVVNKELEALSDEELTSEAQIQIANVVPFTVFMEELIYQKLLRGTFQDEQCEERVFKDVEEVKNLHTLIKQQLEMAFDSLEFSPDEVKNS